MSVIWKSIPSPSWPAKKLRRGKRPMNGKRQLVNLAGRR
jgi:hypothetical protein